MLTDRGDAAGGTDSLFLCLGRQPSSFALAGEETERQWAWWAVAMGEGSAIIIDSFSYIYRA